MHIPQKFRTRYRLPRRLFLPRIEEYFAQVVGIDKTKHPSTGKTVIPCSEKGIQYIHSAFEDISDDLKVILSCAMDSSTISTIP